MPRDIEPTLDDTQHSLHPGNSTTDQLFWNKFFYSCSEVCQCD